MNKDERNSEGLLTHIWGPSFWHVLHSITFNYPTNPKDEEKEQYKIFFKSLCFVIPCCECRGHFTKHIGEGETMFTDEVLENRESLSKWLYNFHNVVNKRLGVLYNLSYDEIHDRYNSYIANCELTDEQRQNAFKNYYNKEAPRISNEYAECFINYAKKKGI